MSMVNFYLIVALLAKISLCDFAGPVGELKLYEIGLCDPDINKYGITIELVTNADESKALNFKAELPFDIDDTIDLTIIGDKWNKNDWEKDAMNYEKKAMDMLNIFCPTVWGDLRKAASPQIKDARLVPAGRYELSNFRADSSRIDFPQILYGRFRVKMIISKDEEEFLCIRGEGESFQPSLPKMF